MCCILCEEPVRSLTIGLAAVGLVTIVRTVQKSLKSAQGGAHTEAHVDSAANTATAAIPDEVP
jgi:hypothetical protein